MYEYTYLRSVERRARSLLTAESGWRLGVDLSALTPPPVVVAAAVVYSGGDRTRRSLGAALAPPQL